MSMNKFNAELKFNVSTTGSTAGSTTGDCVSGARSVVILWIGISRHRANSAVRYVYNNSTEVLLPSSGTAECESVVII